MTTLVNIPEKLAPPRRVLTISAHWVGDLKSALGCGGLVVWWSALHKRKGGGLVVWWSDLFFCFFSLAAAESDFGSHFIKENVNF